MGGIAGRTMILRGGILWNDNTTGQALLADTYAKMINATANMSVVQGTEPDYTSSEIVCPQACDYDIFANVSIASSTNNVIMHCSIWVNGVESEIETERKISTAGDVGAYSLSGSLVVGAGHAIDLRIKADKNTTITISHAQLWCSAPV